MKKQHSDSKSTACPNTGPNGISRTYRNLFLCNIKKNAAASHGNNRKIIQLILDEDNSAIFKPTGQPTSKTAATSK